MNLNSILLLIALTDSKRQNQRRFNLKDDSNNSDEAEINAETTEAQQAETVDVEVLNAANMLMALQLGNEGTRAKDRSPTRNVPETNRGTELRNRNRNRASNPPAEAWGRFESLTRQVIDWRTIILESETPLLRGQLRTQFILFMDDLQRLLRRNRPLFETLRNSYARYRLDNVRALQYSDLEERIRSGADYSSALRSIGIDEPLNGYSESIKRLIESGIRGGKDYGDAVIDAFILCPPFGISRSHTMTATATRELTVPTGVRRGQTE